MNLLFSMKSAVARLFATGISYTTAILRSALTSGSCGCASNGSHKKIMKSICPSTIFAPICWSPPSGPLQYPFTGSPVFSAIRRAVVPVPHRKCPCNTSLFLSHHSISSFFFPSWATSAMCFAFPISIVTKLSVSIFVSSFKSSCC